MKVAVRKSSSGAMPRREQMLIQRTRTAPLRDLFPQVGHLRIELAFDDPRAPMPSSQIHTLYPAAPGFFRFACPCTDCDGDFDLTASVTSLVEKFSTRKRGDVSVEGTLPCAGVRMRDRAENKTCTMTLTYKIVAVPKGEN